MVTQYWRNMVNNNVVFGWWLVTDLGVVCTCHTQYYTMVVTCHYDLWRCGESGWWNQASMMFNDGQYQLIENDLQTNDCSLYLLLVLSQYTMQYQLGEQLKVKTVLIGITHSSMITSNCQDSLMMRSLAIDQPVLAMHQTCQPDD